jgi:hypothetical protein
VSAQVIHIVVHIFTVFVATYAAVLSWRSLRKAPSRTRRDVDTLALELADLAERHAALLKSHRKLNSRIAMREARAVQAEQNADQLTGGTFKMLPGESESDWKRRCRAAIAAGELKHEH